MARLTRAERREGTRAPRNWRREAGYIELDL
jgi:hypothetical protein